MLNQKTKSVVDNKKEKIVKQDPVSVPAVIQAAVPTPVIDNKIEKIVESTVEKIVKPKSVAKSKPVMEQKPKKENVAKTESVAKQEPVIEQKPKEEKIVGPTIEQIVGPTIEEIVNNSTTDLTLYQNSVSWDDDTLLDIISRLTPDQYKDNYGHFEPVEYLSMRMRMEQIKNKIGDKMPQSDTIDAMTNNIEGPFNELNDYHKTIVLDDDAFYEYVSGMSQQVRADIFGRMSPKEQSSVLIRLYNIENKNKEEQQDDVLTIPTNDTTGFPDGITYAELGSMDDETFIRKYDSMNQDEYTKLTRSYTTQQKIDLQFRKKRIENKKE